MEEIAVSVIVPIYNVERFIERCIRSLMEQTLQDVEFIFVDDATPDNSIRILYSLLKEYSNRIGQVKILVHEKNKGLPAARNTGLAVARGKYIYHCDSDDYMEVDMLELLYNAAIKEDADFIWCDCFLSFEQNERYMKQPNYMSADEMLRIGMLGGMMKYNVWNKLVKRSLYTGNNINFPNGYAMGEDMTMIQLAACCKRVSYVPKALYHYVRFNNSSYTQSLRQDQYQSILYNVERTINFLKEKGLGLNLKKEIEWFKLNVKLPFLITDDKRSYDVWKEWYTESNSFIWSNKRQSIKVRILQWMAWKGHYWYVIIYYKLVYKFIYGFIYK